MASRPKEMRLKRKLAEIAKREGLETPIEWVVSQVASGVTVTQMAKDVAAMELERHPSELFSRNWFSMMVNKLPVLEGERPAKEQIAAARREAAYVLLDHALEISDEPASDQRLGATQQVEERCTPSHGRALEPRRAGGSGWGGGSPRSRSAPSGRASPAQCYAGPQSAGAGVGRGRLRN